MDSNSFIALSDTFAQLVLEESGLDPGDTSGLKQIAAAIKAIADEYCEPRNDPSVFSQHNLAAAYCAYYLPCNAAKLLPVLRELERSSALEPATRPGLRVLDIGCGPGTLLLGLLDYLARRPAPDGFGPLELTGLDRTPRNCLTARRLTERFLTAGPLQNLPRRLEFIAGDLAAPETLRSLCRQQHRFDLIMAGNVIAELAPRELPALARSLDTLLDDDGVIIVIDPGTHRSFRKLLRLREALMDRSDLHLYAPCLHPGICPLQDSPAEWCHEKLFWKPPAHILALDRHTGFTKHKGLKYAYLVFTRSRVGGVRSTFSKAAHDRLWRVVSYVIRNKGEERLYVCNGREKRQLRRLTRITAPQNRDFSEATRGDCIVLDGCTAKKTFFDVGEQAVFQKLE